MPKYSSGFNHWVMNMEKKTNKKKKAKKQETWVCDPALDRTYKGIFSFEYGKWIDREGSFRKRKLPACE